MLGRRKEEAGDGHRLTCHRRIMESRLVFALGLHRLFLSPCAILAWLLHSLTHKTRKIITASMYLYSLYLEISIDCRMRVMAYLHIELGFRTIL